MIVNLDDDIIDNYDVSFALKKRPGQGLSYKVENNFGALIKLSQQVPSHHHHCTHCTPHHHNHHIVIIIIIIFIIINATSSPETNSYSALRILSLKTAVKICLDFMMRYFETGFPHLMADIQ